MEASVDWYGEEDEHYIKEVASKFVIDMNAAMPVAAKRRILTQMCLRVLLNNSEYLIWEDKKKHMEYFMKRMQASGYDVRFRYEILKSAMYAYEVIENNTDRPKYRGKEWYTPEKRKETENKKRNWYRKGNYESVIFIPTTPRSELKKLLEEEIQETELRIKVVEKPGIKVKKILQKNDPFKRKECNLQECFICSTSRKGNCRRTGVTYKITCKGNCNGFVYNGETHANGFTRGEEHSSDYRSKRVSSIMWKHCVKEHEGVEQEFEMEIVDNVRNDPMLRQILESVRINKTSVSGRMNDQTGWNYVKLPRMELV